VNAMRAAIATKRLRANIGLLLDHWRLDDSSARCSRKFYFAVDC
jgi:hypothetical protein